jgi:putative toxin-antitoxin system antitoxin component (TIGR02293 family)
MATEAQIQATRLRRAQASASRRLRSLAQQEDELSRNIHHEVARLFGGNRVLGRLPKGPVDTHELIERGLPQLALLALVEHLHFIPTDEVVKALGISRRTLQRRKEARRTPLSANESGRAWNFAAVLTKATKVFGSQERAEQWLEQPAIALEQRRPIDLLTTPAGIEMVETLLERLDYGVYT